MCYGQQAQTEEKETLKDLMKEQQWTQCSNWEEIQKNRKKQEKGKGRKKTSAFPTNIDFWRRGKKKCRNLVFQFRMKNRPR